MNILILNWRDPKNPKAGGAEYVTFEHAKAWVKQGHSVTWFTTKFDDAPSQEMDEGIAFHRQGNQFSVFYYAYLFYKRSENSLSIIIDEVHGLPFFTPLYARVPIIAFIHEVATEIWDYTYPFPLNVIGRFLEKRALQLYKNHRFWTDAISTVDDLERIGIPRSSCVAIPCPIPNKPLHILPKKESNSTFISVGRLVPMKGIEDVIQAFKYIVKVKKSAKLWIVGLGNAGYVKKLREKIEQNSLTQSIKFWGFISEKEKLSLMSKAHVLLHGSIKEGWGLVVLEAASQATPTVGYNVSGLKDTVINGKTGTLVPRRDPKLLADAALAMLDDPKRYKALQENGLAWVASLRWEEVTKESLKLLQDEVKFF